MVRNMVSGGEAAPLQPQCSSGPAAALPHICDGVPGPDGVSRCKPRPRKRKRLRANDMHENGNPQRGEAKPEARHACECHSAVIAGC